MLKPLRNSYFILFCFALMLHGNVMASTGLVFKNKSKINISKGTFLVLKTNLKAEASISGKGAVVLKNNNANGSVVTAPGNNSSLPVFPTRKIGFISIANNAHVQNLIISTGTFVLNNKLVVSNLLSINNNAKLLLNHYNLYVNNITGNAGNIVKNGSGIIIYANCLAANNTITLNANGSIIPLCPVNHHQLLLTRNINGIYIDVFTRYKSVVPDKNSPPPKLFSA